MKNFRAFICSFAALTFSAIAHAAPVQYQITATHTQETVNGALINPSNYFFADGTIVTTTFYYDSSAPAKIKDQKINFPSYTAFLSGYEVKNDFIFKIDGQTLYSSGGMLTTIDSDTAPSPDALFIDLYTSSSNNNFSQLSFGSSNLNSIRILIGGAHNMLSNRLLPNTLTELNPIDMTVGFAFSNPAGEYRYVSFENGGISQVPLPSAALFFLSGLIGLGAKIFRKANK